ncbi:MAG TPA: UDP-N-acetylmuramoyl-L-alanyl-D-glutamate--2,6-diaminopimelate ligase [Thermoanaerobacterales bacterium]|nr:UDP-N-acetylmuramoyl-L-alanyl-D-glutamate--2,6-diaminopimelate ligase [Thermoanaerobacterales bacterium]
MNLADLLQSLPEVKSVNGSTDKEIEMICYDSRKAVDRSIYVAIPGMHFDGHDFIKQAIQNGAVAIVGENDLKMMREDITYIKVENSRRALANISSWFYGFPAKKLDIIGVTGTNGKTTVTYLLKAILDNAGYNTGVVGTIGNIVKDKLLPAQRTTPESLELNQLFHQMLNQKVSYVAMEVSSHSLELHRVHGIEFDVGVFTNLTQDHLDFHETIEDYFEAKKKLFDFSKRAVINADDSHGLKLVDALKIPVTTYGIYGDADLKAENIKISVEGVFYDINIKGEVHNVFYPIPGLFSVYNSLCAICVGSVLNIPIEITINALKKVKGIPGRFEPIKRGQDFSVIIDYAHTPDGLENVLKTIKSFCKGRIITVFGCGGDRDKKKRPLMGKIASNLSDYTIITSDNPRSEDPEEIIAQVENGFDKKNYEKITDRRQAIKKAIYMANKDDVVLIAGKGHEDYQILMDETIHFDDREVAIEFLGKRGFNDETH